MHLTTDCLHQEFKRIHRPNASQVSFRNRPVHRPNPLASQIKHLMIVCLHQEPTGLHQPNASQAILQNRPIRGSNLSSSILHRNTSWKRLLNPSQLIPRDCPTHRSNFISSIWHPMTTSLRRESKRLRRPNTSQLTPRDRLLYRSGLVKSAPPKTHLDHRYHMFHVDSHPPTDHPMILVQTMQTTVTRRKGFNLGSSTPTLLIVGLPFDTGT